MKIGIFADTHDHLDNLRAAVAVFNQCQCSYVLFAGDLVSTFAVPCLRKLRCPVIACFGDNEGNKAGLLAGFGIVGTLGEPPICFRSPDGVRFLIAHMQRQTRGLLEGADVVVYAHTHKPAICVDHRGRLHINPGETSGWTFGNPTVVVLDTTTLHPQLVELRPNVPVPSGSTD